MGTRETLRVARSRLVLPGVDSVATDPPNPQNEPLGLLSGLCKRGDCTECGADIAAERPLGVG